MRGCFLDVGAMGPDLDWSGLEATLAEWDWYRNSTDDVVSARIAGADVVVTNKVVLDENAIAGAADSLRLICVAATGTDNIDLAAANACNVPVVNVRGYAVTAVAERVLAFMLAFATRWPEYDALVKDGGWTRSEFFCRLDYRIEELSGSTLGIVGSGDLGQAVARLARCFGMEVLFSERAGSEYARPHHVLFEELLERADFISLHCPLTAETRNLIDGDALDKMKPSSVLINTARGAIVDSVALVEALRNGAIAGAAVDVVDVEPPAEDHPLTCQNVRNLIITPHNAWGSRAARQRVLDQLALDINQLEVCP